MKKVLLSLAVVLALLFLCYRLLFVVLDLASGYMDGDADINRAGKLFLFLCPIIMIGGGLIARRVYGASHRAMACGNTTLFFLSVYGGLLGVVIVDVLLRAIPVELANHRLMYWTIALSFGCTAVATFYSAKRRLIGKPG